MKIWSSLYGFLCSTIQSCYNTYGILQNAQIGTPWLAQKGVVWGIFFVSSKYDLYFIFAIAAPHTISWNNWLCYNKAGLYKYRQVSNTRRTLLGNKIVDHSDVVGASPDGAAPTTVGTPYNTNVGVQKIPDRAIWKPVVAKRNNTNPWSCSKPQILVTHDSRQVQMAEQPASRWPWVNFSPHAFITDCLTTL